MDYYNPSKSIAAAYRLGQSFLRSRLKDLGIETHQTDFLYAVSKREGVSQQWLSDELMVSKAAIAQATKTMISFGYIERHRSTDDKRAFQLFLTDKGRGVALQLDEAFGDLIQTHLDALTEGEREQFKYLLTKIITKLSEERTKQEDVEGNEEEL